MRRPGRDVPPHRAGYSPLHIVRPSRNYHGRAASALMAGVGQFTSSSSSSTATTAAQLQQATTAQGLSSLWQSPGGPALLGALGLTAIGIFGSGGASLGDHGTAAEVLEWVGILGGAALAAVASVQISQASTQTGQPGAQGAQGQTTAGLRVGSVGGSLGYTRGSNPGDTGGFPQRIPSAVRAASPLFKARERARQGYGISWQLKGY